ncbi:hypothetical protein FACS1894211_02560 [Clostridia bacterium]|nr:hypothetical protein FACS1894211_02560 [Clostridia bacterium]
MTKRKEKRYYCADCLNQFDELKYRYVRKGWERPLEKYCPFCNSVEVVVNSECDDFVEWKAGAVAK